jgi:hypothetical protein
MKSSFIHRTFWALALIGAATTGVLLSADGPSTAYVDAQEPKKGKNDGPVVVAQMDLDTDDWAYTSNSGVILTAKNSRQGEFALRFDNPLEQEYQLVITEGILHHAVEIRANGWANTYQGWAYKVNFSGSKRPKYVFVSNEKSKGSGSGYPVAFYRSDEEGWYDAGLFQRSRPVGVFMKESKIIRNSH